MFPFHAFNEHKQVGALVNRIKGGEKMAVVSDAGTPGISDPAFLLVRACIREGIEVECLPGPVAFVPALIQSGLPCNEFVFCGFLPQKKGKHTAIASLEEEHRTLIFYESPHRLVKTLMAFSEVFGMQREACVCRELTKLHEETVRGTLESLLNHFGAKNIKGEIVIIVAGKKKKKKKHGQEEE